MDVKQKTKVNTILQKGVDFMKLIIHFIPDDTLDIFNKIWETGDIKKKLFIAAYIIIMLVSIAYIIIYAIGFYDYTFEKGTSKNINTFLIERNLSILILNIIILVSLACLIYILYNIHGPSLKKSIRIYLMICCLFLVLSIIIFIISIEFTPDPFTKSFMDRYSHDYDSDLKDMIKPLLYFKKKYPIIDFKEFFDVSFKYKEHEEDKDHELHITTFSDYTSLIDESGANFNKDSTLNAADLTMKIDNNEMYNEAISVINYTLKNDTDKLFLKLPISIAINVDETKKPQYIKDVSDLNQHISQYNKGFMKHKLNLNSNPVLILTLTNCISILTLCIFLIIKCVIIAIKKKN